MDSAKSLKSQDVPTDTWPVLSSGFVHKDPLEFLSSVAVNDAVHIVLVPPSERFVTYEDTLYGITEKEIDLHFCEAPNQKQGEGSVRSLSNILSYFMGSL